MVRKTHYRKGQTGANAGILLIVITVLIILYMLFLPPADREVLLSGSGTPGSVNGGGTGGTGGTGTLSTAAYFLSQKVGTIYYQSDTEKDIDMQTLTVNTATKGQILKQKSTVYIKNSVFQDISETMDFATNPNLEKNLILSFNINKGEGALGVYLNGKLVYRGETTSGNSPPIYLEASLLHENNTLTFEVSSPGIAFWNYNEYTLSNVKITGDVTDISTSTGVQTFSVKSSDLGNLNSARLRYLPDCKETEMKNFEVDLNGQQLFRGTPDCGVYNYLNINKNDLIAGSNRVNFKIERGRVLADRLQIQLLFDKPNYPTYYFDMDTKYFTSKTITPECGKADGICPAGCSELNDRDCCLARSDNYWCPTITDNYNDRCVSYVNDCARCASGYEDRSGNPPDKCVTNSAGADVAYCGDDTDGICPTGCSQYYDKDCCFESSDNYWCSVLPVTGLQGICKPSIGSNECSLCPTGYKNSDGHTPSCKPQSTFEDNGDQLLSSYQVKISFTFPNNNHKEFDVWVNGAKFSVNTLDSTYEKVIDEYVKSGTNSIYIEPQRDVTITDMQVRLLK